MDKETVGHQTRGVTETVVARGSGGGTDDQVEHRGSWRQWSYPVCYYNGRYGSLYICSSPQNVHQEWTLMSTMDFRWRHVNVGSLIITNLPSLVGEADGEGDCAYLEVGIYVEISLPCIQFFHGPKAALKTWSLLWKKRKERRGGQSRASRQDWWRYHTHQKELTRYFLTRLHPRPACLSLLHKVSQPPEVSLALYFGSSVPRKQEQRLQSLWMPKLASHSVTVTVFYWSRQVTDQPRHKRWGNRLHFYLVFAWL